jgi:hypothetical protein
LKAASSLFMGSTRHVQDMPGLPPDVQRCLAVRVRDLALIVETEQYEPRGLLHFEQGSVE